jgi:hypothetical protein
LSIYWRLARPELLRKWKASEKGKGNPVSSDAFSRFAQGSEGEGAHNKNVTAMTKYMLNTCVKAAAAALDGSDAEPVAVILHREGVNVRHLDKLLATIKGECRLKTADAQMRVAKEMLGRTSKNLLRRAMRDTITRGGTISQLTEVVFQTFNRLTRASDEDAVGVYWDSVRDGARGRFGARNLDKFLLTDSLEVAAATAVAVAAAKSLEGLGCRMRYAFGEEEDADRRDGKPLIYRGTIGPFNAINGKHQIKFDGAYAWEDEEKTRPAIWMDGVYNLKDPEYIFVFEGSEAYLKVQIIRGFRYFGVDEKISDADLIAYSLPKDATASGETKDEPSDEALLTNEIVCRQNPRDMILRLAGDVGIELTPECLRDFTGNGTEFKFTATDIAQLKPRVKFLNILDKAEGMALASDLDKESTSADVATKRRLAHQSTFKLRTAMGGVFPDLEVATKLAEVRRTHIQFETDADIVKETVSKSFEELNVMRWNDEADKERVENVMELVGILRVVFDKGDLVDGGFRNDTFVAAFETLSPKGRKQDDEMYEKWMDHTIELAQLVRSDEVLSMLEKFDLLYQGLKGFERADEEKRRVVAEIMKEPSGE